MHISAINDSILVFGILASVVNGGVLVQAPNNKQDKNKYGFILSSGILDVLIIYGYRSDKVTQI